MSQPDITTQLLRWAWDDENIRAVVFTGSRADPTRTVDELSDFDLTVFVRDLDPVTSNPEFPEQFGSVIVRWPLQPESTLDPAWITQLVLYESGLRIDFQFATVETREAERPADLFCVLVDKDLLTDSLSGTPIDGATIPPPNEAEFLDRINAFWWDIPYVAKALSRGELPYARFVLEGDLRFNKLHPLLRWHIGIKQGTAIDVGIFGRWFERFLEPELWESYLETFSGSDARDNQRAMFAMTRLVRTLGQTIADAYGFRYPMETDERVTRYLKKITISSDHQ